MVERDGIAFEKLTPREREILRLIAAHLQSKEIARALGLSPKTVEMHVLGARRRLAGLSRRDAALAFMAWESGTPGNDYRKRPDDLAALPSPPLAGREIGNSGHERASRVPDTRTPAPAPGGTERPPGRGPAASGDWRHELSVLQWLGLVLGFTALIAGALAVIAVGMEVLIMTLQRLLGH